MIFRSQFGAEPRIVKQEDLPGPISWTVGGLRTSKFIYVNNKKKSLSLEIRQNENFPIKGCFAVATLVEKGWNQEKRSVVFKWTTNGKTLDQASFVNMPRPHGTINPQGDKIALLDNDKIVVLQINQ